MLPLPSAAQKTLLLLQCPLSQAPLWVRAFLHSETSLHSTDSSFPLLSPLPRSPHQQPRLFPEVRPKAQPPLNYPDS